MKTLSSMLQSVTLSLFILAMAGTSNVVAQSFLPDPEATASKVFDHWTQQTNFLGGLADSTAVNYLGYLAMYRSTHDDKYLAKTLQWARRIDWKLSGFPGENCKEIDDLEDREKCENAKPNNHRAHPKEADRQVLGQAYIELYQICKKENHPLCRDENADEMLGAIRESIGHVMDPITAGDLQQRYQDYSWFWIDAMFMAAPIFSAFGAFDDDNLDGNPSPEFDDDAYYDKMRALYDETKAELYDSDASLWYRDYKFVPPAHESSATAQHCGTDNKIFWSRGNGWVIASLSRLLEYLENRPADQQEYTSMLANMATQLATIQRPGDGFWNRNLGDDSCLDGPESTGTSLFTYAVASGINRGYLDQAPYLNMVCQAWDGLANQAVQPNGRLDFVQPSGREPCSGDSCTVIITSESKKAAYGVGTFLLAASEMTHLVDQCPSSPTSDHIIQAEVAQLGGGSRVESNHVGFHGTGFVNFPRDNGYVEWHDIDGGPGGLTTLSFRHALRPSASRTAALIVNGMAQDLTFPSTGDWTTWEQLDVVVDLDPGPSNTIRVETTGQDSANLDEMSVAYQAEDARVDMGGGSRVESNHDGHHGTGFINFPRNGGYIEWSGVDGGDCGLVTLSFRYALGATNGRNVRFIVNGTEQTFTLEPTGSWSTWEHLIFNASVNPSPSNSIRIQSIGEDSGNIDELLITDICP